MYKKHYLERFQEREGHSQECFSWKRYSCLLFLVYLKLSLCVRLPFLNFVWKREDVSCLNGKQHRRICLCMEQIFFNIKQKFLHKKHFLIAKHFAPHSWLTVFNFVHASIALGHHHLESVYLIVKKMVGDISSACY